MKNPVNLEKRYLYVLKRWWFLLLLLPVLASVVGYKLFKDPVTLYESQSQVLIGPGVDSPDPDLNSLRASAQVMQIYEKIATTDSFLQPIIDQLKLGKSIKTGDLRGMIDISADTNSFLLSITVQSDDRNLAVDVANAVANNLYELSPTNPDSPVSILRQQNRDEAIKLSETIQQSRSTITALEAELQQFNDVNPAGTYDVYKNLDSSDNSINSLEANFQEANGVAEKTQLGDQIIQELITQTLLRITQLHESLAKTDPDLQNFVIEQISAENDHLSELQKAASENKQLIEGQPLPDYIQATENNITDLQEKLKTISVLDLNQQKFYKDQIDQERNRLTDAEKITSDREQLVLDQLANERSRLSDLRMVPVNEKQFLDNEIIAERNRLSTMQNNYTNLNAVVYQVLTNQVLVAQVANKSTKVPSNYKLYIELTGLAGLALALTIILAIGFFDTSIQTADEIEKSIGILALGMVHKKIPFLRMGTSKVENLAVRTVLNSQAIADYQMLDAKLSLGMVHKEMPFLRMRTSKVENLAVRTMLDSQAIADYQMLAAKLSLLLGLSGVGLSESHERGSKKISTTFPKTQTVLICGLYAEGYASEVAANLAITLSRFGQHILLVDSNLHNPAIAAMFEIDAQNGVSTTLLDPSAPLDYETIPFIDNLKILPSGPVPADAFGLLSSSAVKKMIDSFKEQANLVLIVGSPLMAFADSLILAAQTDRLVLVVPDRKLGENQVDNFVKTQETYKWEIVGAVVVKKERDFFYLLKKLIRWSRSSDRKIRRNYAPQLGVKKDTSLPEQRMSSDKV